MISDVVLWLYYAPSKFIGLVTRTSSLVLRRIKALTVFCARAVLICGAGFLAITSTYVIAHLAYRSYRSYQAKQYLRGIEETRAQRRIQIQEEQNRQWEQEQRRRDEEARSEELRNLRQRAAERKREAEERVRLQEQERQRRREEALREQYRLEDLRLYNRWKTACDSVFDAGSGELPEPPFWPCSEISCQEVRQLRACRHNFERLFSATGNTQQTLRSELLRWHPNRAIFHKLQPGSERMATEITQAIASLQR